ncbi:MAG TPA: hypothetical protein DCL77_04120, partial [Prolixibacteraceae bacterium]|nr:hypothetical protein [Prolixibacteraceae bacterium]
GADAGNYTANTTTVTTASITARPLTVSATGINKVYDGILTATVSLSDNRLSGDVFITAYLSATFVDKNVGSGKPVSVSGISKSGTDAGNYTANTTAATTASITARPITITADANQSKYIGQVDPTLTYQITSGSLVTGDSFSGSLSRATGECAGNYAISKNSVSLSTNYTLSYVGANFTINGVSIDASQSSTPVPTGTSATLWAKVTPAAAGITVTFTLDNGTTATFPTYSGITDITGTAKATVDGLPVEVYKVTALIGTCASSTAAYLAVYDPNGGFVTGGGWINSPAGAYAANPALTGKANFGFNSKYEKGKTTPTGNTEFQFQTGNLNFSSSTYGVGSLVIAGSKATYKGVGTINGSGNYAFMVSAVDGDVSGGGGIDKFRIKIWDGNNVIYDNNMGKDENDLPLTALGGGSIVIHEVKTKAAIIIPESPSATVEPLLKAYPNPFTEKLNIEFASATDTQATLEIYSITGAKLATLFNGQVNKGQLYTFEYLPRLVSSQMVLYHLTINGETHVGKMVYQERK